jgi:hypothetical protein
VRVGAKGYAASRALEREKRQCFCNTQNDNSFATPCWKTTFDKKFHTGNNFNWVNYKWKCCPLIMGKTINGRPNKFLKVFLESTTLLENARPGSRLPRSSCFCYLDESFIYIIYILHIEIQLHYMYKSSISLDNWMYDIENELARNISDIIECVKMKRIMRTNSSLRNGVIINKKKNPFWQAVTVSIWFYLAMDYFRRRQMNYSQSTHQSEIITAVKRSSVTSTQNLSDRYGGERRTLRHINERACEWIKRFFTSRIYLILIKSLFLHITYTSWLKMIPWYFLSIISKFQNCYSTCKEISKWFKFVL